RTRELDVVDVETPTASPYAASLLFDYVANYMYEDDTPPAERRAQALSLDRDLRRELLGQEELRDLLDPDALEAVERDLQREPRTPDELHDRLRLRGDLRAGEYDEALARPLLDERRAVHVRIAGEERLIAAEDAGRYRDALGASPTCCGACAARRSPRSGRRSSRSNRSPSPASCRTGTGSTGARPSARGSCRSRGLRCRCRCGSRRCCRAASRATSRPSSTPS